MTRSVLLVGAAMLIAAPAQAGGLLGGMGSASNDRKSQASSANHGSSGAALVGIKAKARAGVGVGSGSPIRSAGLNGVRASAGTVLAGSVRAIGTDSTMKARGKLGVAVGLAGKVHGNSTSSVRGIAKGGIGAGVGGLGTTGVKAQANLGIGLAGKVHGSRNLATARVAGNSALATVKVGTAGNRLATVRVGGANILASVKVNDVAKVRIGGSRQAARLATVKVGSIGSDSLAKVRVGDLAKVRIGGRNLASVNVGTNGAGHIGKVRIGTAGGKIRAKAVLPGRSADTGAASLALNSSVAVAAGPTGDGSPGNGTPTSPTPQSPATTGSQGNVSAGTGQGTAAAGPGSGRPDGTVWRACDNGKSQPSSDHFCNAN